jgi:hypothetical protein
MSIYGNIYIKRNKEVELVIDRIAGNDYAFIEIIIADDTFPRHHALRFLIDAEDAYKLGSLLYQKAEGTGTQGMDDWYDNKIKSYEYAESILGLTNEEWEKECAENKSKWWQGRTKTNLEDIKKRLLNDIEMIDNELKGGKK